MLEMNFPNEKPETYHLLYKLYFIYISCILSTCNNIDWITYLLTLYAALSTKFLLKYISTFINFDNLSSLAHSWCVSDNKSHGELLNVVPWDDIPWHPQPHW